MNYKIALFDARPYDRESFYRFNQESGFDVSCLETRLYKAMASLVRGIRQSVH